MSEERVPINEFRARTAEILKTIQETKATYVITNRGEPVAEVVPYGTPLRKRGKPLLGIFDSPDYVSPWEEEGITHQEYVDRRRAQRLAEQEARYKKLAAQIGWDAAEDEPAE
ncbi:MAG TPA: type II toxin-antitoxin system Phd/YefM family antitoxin [Chloroflexota bacterium]|nr:type II toxin-antitoxin system Phd/YefM family antitoxin [Chloroflexota bacterium]